MLPKFRSVAVGLMALLILLFGVSANVFAQRLDGTLRGEVKDPTGAVIAQAKVVAVNEASGTQVETLTEAGIFVFPNLLVGNYTITIEKTGFRKYLRKNIEVLSNRVVDVIATLQVGAETTTVEVTAGAEVVQTTTATLGATFGGRVVNEMPISTLGGSVLELAVGFPNTTTAPGGIIGQGGSVGGARPIFNSFTIDGVDDNRVDITGPISPVIQDAVAEFTLLQNQFSAEYGHSAGGLFNITTKSGGNAWHGETHLYNQNRHYNAMDNLEKGEGLTEPRRFDYNRVGGSIGGPVMKDKFFIFGAYERQWRGQAATSSSVIAPTATGMTQLNALAANSTIQNLLTYFPIAAAADPTLTTIVNGTPIQMGSFQAAAPDFFNQHDFNVNADLNLSKHQIRGRFLFDRYRAPWPNPQLPLGMFTGAQVSDSRKFILSDAWSLSSRMANEFHAAYTRFIQGYTVPSIGSYGPNFPNVEIDALSLNIGPEGNSPQSYTQNVYQLSDQMTWARGSHTLKWGVEFRAWTGPSDFLPRARGEWDYASLNTFINDQIPDGLNAALRGAGSGLFDGNQHAWYTFFQDDWRIHPRLTLNLGLRYEWVANPNGANLQTLDAIADDPTIVLPFGLGTGLIFRQPKTDKNNFSPRFGFAWDPTGSGKWAVRGGAMIAFDVTRQNLPLLQLPPQLQTEQNPILSCTVDPNLTYCGGTLPGNGATPGRNFLAAGGLVAVNVPPASTAEARAATQGIIVDTVQPKIITWSLGVQRELMPNTTLELRYMGTHAMSMPAQIRLNSMSGFDGGLAEMPTYFSASSVPAAVVNPNVTLATWDNWNPQPLSADGFFTNFSYFPPWGQSIYHSGSVDVVRRMSKGLYLRGNYTYAHNIDNGTTELFSSYANPRRALDNFNLKLDRGRSALDIRHKFALSWVYDLPNISTDSGLVGKLLHGWTYSGTYLAQGGQPVTPLSGYDSNGNWDVAGDRALINPNGTNPMGGSDIGFVCNDGPNGATRITTSILPSGYVNCGAANDANVVGYVALDPTARYVAAGPGTRTGMAGRNSIQSPGFNIFNMSFIKTTKISERVSVQFRAETYNTFNHRNFTLGNPSIYETDENALNSAYPFVYSPSFLDAHIFNGGSRRMQLGLKVVF